MALNLGELFGTIGLDASEWDKKLKGAQGSLKAFGVAGAALAVTAAVAIGAALSKGIADSIDISAGQSKLKAQLALTAEQAGKAGEAAGNLYANNFGGSMEEVQTATGAVMSSIQGMKNASAADIEDITGKALNLASAFDVDVNEAASSAGILMKNGLAKDAGQAMDLITDAMTGVPAAMRGEILPIMDEYGKHFKTLGIDGTTAMGIVKASAQDGAIGMDKMGDALKEFTLLTVAGDKVQSAAFESIGLNTAEMSTAMAKGGAEGQAAFEKVIGGLQDIEDPALQAQTAIALFGTPLEDLGTDNIPAFLGQLDPMGDKFDDVGGAAEQLNKDLNDNAKAGFDGFKRQADAALIKFVQDKIMPSVDKFASFLNTDVGPAIKNIADWIDNDALPALGRFQQWLTDNKDAIQGWATFIGAVMLPVFVRVAVAATVSAAAQVTAWALAAGGAVKTAIVYVVQSYIMIGRFLAMSAAAIAHGIVVAAVWTWQVIASAVKGAIAMGIQAGLIIASWVLMSVRATIEAAKQAAAWVVGVLIPAAGAAIVMGVQAAIVIGHWVLMAVQSGINAAKMALAWLIGVGIPAVAGAITMGIQAGIVVGAWVLMAVQAMIQAGRMAIAWFIAMGPVGWVIGIVVLLAALIIANWDAISKFTQEAWANISNFVSEKWNDIVNLFTNPDLLKNAAKYIMDGFLGGLKTGFEEVQKFVGGIGEWIAKNKGPKPYDLKLLVPNGGWIMKSLETGIKSGLPALKDTLGGVAASISDGVSPTMNVSATGTAALTGTAPAAAPAPAGFVQNVNIHEASNTDEIVQKVWTKFQYKMKEAGVRV